jgi:hypothetical protein
MSNSSEDENELREPDYEEDKDELEEQQEEEAGEITTTTNQVLFREQISYFGIIH